MDPNDGGFASRKLWFSIGTSLTILGLGIASALWSPLAAQYQLLIGGLLGTLGIYCGANVSSRYLTGKCALPVTVSPPIEPLPE